MATLSLITIIVIVVMLGVVAAEIMQFRTRLERSKELIASTVPFSASPAGATMRILVAGDSTAVGVGASDPAGSTAGQLSALFPQAAIVNIGESGLRVEKLADQLLPHETEHFELIVLQIGGNDITHFTRLSELERGLEAALKRAAKMSPRVLLLTSGDVGTAPIFPQPLQLLYTKRTREVRDVFMQTADRSGVTYVDLFEPREHDPFIHDPKTFYAADDFHPSSAGYEHWFKKIGPAAAQVLQQ